MEPGGWRSALESLRARWSSAAGLSLRALAVLALALWGTRYYARVLDRSYPVKDWLAWTLGKLWGYGLLFNVALVCLGFVIVHRLCRQRALPPLELLVMSAAAGAVGFSTAMSVLGWLGLYNGPAALALAAGCIAAGGPGLARHLVAAREGITREPVRPLVAAAWAFGAIGVLFVYLTLLSPDAMNYDATWCHLTVPQDYARHGRMVPFPGDYARNHPHLAGMLHTWGWIVPGLSQPERWMMALHTEFWLFLWTLGGVAAATRCMLGDTTERGTWAAFFLFPAIFVYDHNIGGAADHVLAFFAAPMLLAALRAARSMSAGSFALLAVVASGAILTKFQGGYLLLPIAIYLGVAWLRRLAGTPRAERPRDLWLGGPLAVPVLLAVLTAPHFGTNWVYYGNPFYPFGQETWKGSHPVVPGGAFLVEHVFKDWNWRPHGTPLENLKEAVKLAFEFSFEPHYSFTKYFPMFGSLFTLGLPLLPLVGRGRRIWPGALIGLGALVVWGLTFRVDRNLQGFAPILIATTGAILVRAWDLGWVARAGLVVLVGLQVIWGGDAVFYSGHDRLRGAVDLIRSGYEGRARVRLDGYRADYRALTQALPRDARVLLHNNHLSLGLDRDVILDWPAFQGLIGLDGVRSTRGLVELWRRHGLTHVVHVPGWRPAATKQDEVLFAELRFRAGDVKRFGPLELFPVPAAGAGKDLRVLALGLWGYRNGLYPVEAMTTHEGLPAHLLAWPAPAVPLAPAEDAQTALLAQADVVLVGAGQVAPPAMQRELGTQFAAGISYRSGFTVFHRRQPR